MDNKSADSSEVTDLSKVSTPEELISYLSSKYVVSERSNQYYHYTRLSSILEIIKSGYWIIRNPRKMNDHLEYQNWNENAWENIFFVSFMCEQKESIAMWGLYAQPWETGVKVTIERKALQQWIKNVSEVYSANSDTFAVDESTVYRVNEDFKIKLSGVAYSNFEPGMTSKEETIRLNSPKSALLKKATGIPLLTGYIKNDAWNYEKEIRLRIDMNKKIQSNAVAIKLTDELIDAITIVKGPRFKGDLQEAIEDQLNRDIKSGTSLFFDRLKQVPCDTCSHARGDYVKLETKRLVIESEIRIQNGAIDFEWYKNKAVDLSNLKPYTGKEAGFICYSKTTREEICHIYLSSIEDKIEISYGTEEAFRNQSYMTEALPLVIAWIFANTDTKELYARICDNAYSEHILVKNGFKPSGISYPKSGNLYVLVKEGNK